MMKACISKQRPHRQSAAGDDYKVPRGSRSKSGQETLTGQTEVRPCSSADALTSPNPSGPRILPYRSGDVSVSPSPTGNDAPEAPVSMDPEAAIRESGDPSGDPVSPGIPEVADGADAAFWARQYKRPITKSELFEIKASMLGLFDLLLRIGKKGAV